MIRSAWMAIAALSAAISVSAPAATVDLSAYVDANASTYSSGEDYPVGDLVIGGVTFSLASFQGGTGVVQIIGEESVNIPVNQSGVNTAYVIVNSAFGAFGANNGTLVFNGPSMDFRTFGPSLVGGPVVVDLIQGQNIRDHFNNGFNNVATDTFATADYPGGNRFDVYRYDISSLGGTLSSVTFGSPNATVPEGQPFLAAITTTFEAAGVPEPSIWALMIVGFGAIGGTMRSARGRSILV